jgi:cardiolipin synthase
MKTAALGGVDVQLMIPAKTDARLVEWASKSYLEEILEAGVKVLLYQEGFNHSKLLVSDDMLSTCGSTNIDFRSFENNFEGNAFIYDAEVAQRMKAVFLEDAQYCRLLDENTVNERRSFFKRLWESVIRLFSPLL